MRMCLLLVSLKAPFSCLPLSGYHALRCSIVGCMSSSDIRFDHIHPCHTVALSSRNDTRLYPLADRYLLLQQSESCYDNSLLRPSASKPGWRAAFGSWSFLVCSLWSMNSMSSRLPALSGSLEMIVDICQLNPLLAYQSDCFSRYLSRKNFIAQSITIRA